MSSKPRFAQTYCSQCGGEVGPGDAGVSHCEDHLRAAAPDLLTALAAAPQPEQEPVAWMWQHDETGRVGFVDPWQVENGWQENNLRCKLIRPLYTAPQSAPDDKLRKAARMALEVLDDAGSRICEVAHHAKADRHDPDEPCPVEQRRVAAMIALRAALGEKDE